jgi:hypothetical protein
MFIAETTKTGIYMERESMALIPLLLLLRLLLCPLCI